MPVRYSSLPSAHAAPLHFDFSIVDVVAVFRQVAAQEKAGLAHRIPVNQAREFAFPILRKTAVDVVLAQSDNGLVITVGAFRQGKKPVTVGQRVMHGAPFRAPHGLLPTQAVTMADVKQII